MSLGTFAPADMQLSPAKVYWQAAGATASNYLGGTLKNVKISFGYKKAPIKADQTGDALLDRRISGFECKIETEIAQTQDMQIFNTIFPNTSLTGGSPYTGSSPSAAVIWNSEVGNSDLSVAGVLTLHPQNYPTTNINYDWTFYKAIASEMSAFEFGPAAQAAWKIEWDVLLDTSTASSATPGRWFRVGNINY